MEEPKVGQLTGNKCPGCGKPVKYTAEGMGDIENGPMGLMVYDPEYCPECIHQSVMDGVDEIEYASDGRRN